MVAVTLYLCSGRLDRPLAAFPSTIVDVSETATVASVLQEAGADQFNTFQLVTDDLHADVTPRIENDECFGTAINLAGVGEDGRFQYSGPDTTVGDLRRACEQGIFGGDPRTWIVHRESGAAGGWSPDGLAEISAWLLDQAGAAAIGFAVAKGLDAVSQVRYRKIRKDWRERGFTAPRLRRLLLKQAQWDENALARLLGIEIAEVRCVLRQAGYAQSPDELWRPSEGPDNVARRAKLDAIVEDAENDTP
jgi:hypothetical protein